jgi:hypothetical protein
MFAETAAHLSQVKNCSMCCQACREFYIWPMPQVDPIWPKSLCKLFLEYLRYSANTGIEEMPNGCVTGMAPGSYSRLFPSYHVSMHVNMADRSIDKS